LLLAGGIFFFFFFLSHIMHQHWTHRFLTQEESFSSVHLLCMYPIDPHVMRIDCFGFSFVNGSDLFSPLYTHNTQLCTKGTDTHASIASPLFNLQHLIIVGENELHGYDADTLDCQAMHPQSISKVTRLTSNLFSQLFLTFHSILYRYCTGHIQEIENSILVSTFIVYPFRLGLHVEFQEKQDNFFWIFSKKFKNFEKLKILKIYFVKCISWNCFVLMPNSNINIRYEFQKSSTSLELIRNCFLWKKVI
jgi:hypothetical protein